MTDADKVSYDDEVDLTWGEPAGSGSGPSVERHTQTIIRATVIERPFPAQKK